MYALTFVHPGKTWQTALHPHSYPYQQSHLSCESVGAPYLPLDCYFGCQHVFGENRWRNPHLAGSKNEGKIMEQVNFSPLLFITLVSRAFLVTS